MPQTRIVAVDSHSGILVACLCVFQFDLETVSLALPHTLLPIAVQAGVAVEVTLQLAVAAEAEQSNCTRR